MRRAYRAACAIAALAAGQAIGHAQIFESFEGSTADYIPAPAGGAFVTSADAARHGPHGALFSSTKASFFYNESLPTRAGERYRAWVRLGGQGRAYFGIDADSDGAFSVVLASNTGELMLQDNTEWKFEELNEVALDVQPEVWYQLEIDWAEDGMMVGRVYSEGGTLLAETRPHDSGRTGSGGLSLRGFGILGVSIDAVERVEKATCYADCDESGDLDFFDFLCFQDAFAFGIPYADCDGSDALDFFDFLCFQNEFAAGCEAGLKGFHLELAAPPSELDGAPLAIPPADGRTLGRDETDAPGAGCGKIIFSEPLRHVRVGAGWATWSHGYQGDVYIADDDRHVTIGLPPATSRFVTYVQPSPFEDVEFEFSVVSGSETVRFTDIINGQGGAKGYGFSDDNYIAGVTIQPTDGVTTFAIGEFRLRTECATITNLGVDVPPSELCFPTAELTEFAADPRPAFTDVAFVSSPTGGAIEFDFPLNHRRIGQGWKTWSHGYTGDVYSTNSFSRTRIDLPKGTRAFRMGVEPSPFSNVDFEIRVNNGARKLPATIHGDAAAQSFGFCGTLKNVEVIAVDPAADFGIGEFAIAH